MWGDLEKKWSVSSAGGPRQVPGLGLTVTGYGHARRLRVVSGAGDAPEAWIRLALARSLRFGSVPNTPDSERDSHQQVALCVNLRNENRYLRKLRKEIMVIA